MYLVLILCYCHLFVRIFLILCSCVVIFFFFFFQAEDGIRDADVTGVQTCALPIYTKLGFLQKKKARQKVKELSEKYGLAIDMDAKVEDRKSVV